MSDPGSCPWVRCVGPKQRTTITAPHLRKPRTSKDKRCRLSLIRLLILVAFALMGASCGTSIVPETTNSIDRAVETTLTEPISTAMDSTVVTSTTGTVSTISSTTSMVKDSTPSTTIVTTTTVLSKRQSPAWIESQELAPVLSGVGDSNLEHTRSANDYFSSNPNDISTPMGALCWAYHELVRSMTMDGIRYILDQFMVPLVMDDYGITDEQVGPAGPEATDAFLDLVSGSSGSVGSTEQDTTTDDTIEYIRIEHEFAGDGTAWLTAVRAVASPEMVAAFKMDEGLPVDVQVYADALVAFARERVGKDINLSAESDDLSFGSPGFLGIESFIEAAKYHQDCQRIQISNW